MTITDSALNLSSSVNVGVGGALSWTTANDSWVLNTGTGLGVTFFSMGLKFSLGLLPDYLDFYNLYDQYKINRIKIKLTPYSTVALQQSGVGTANNQPLGVIVHNLVDLDDGTPFASSAAGINFMRQYSTYKTRNLLNSSGKPISRYWKPRIALGAYDSASSTAKVNTKPMWIDMVYTNVEHYGYKLLFQVFQPDTAVPIFIWFKLEATYYFECKQPR